MTDLLLVAFGTDTPGTPRHAHRASGESARADGPDRVAAARRPGRLAAGVLATVMSLAPLPFGSNGPVPVALLCLALAVGLGCAPLPRRAPQRWLLLALVGLAASIGGIVFVQVRPGLGADPVWTETARLLGEPLAGSIALVRDAPLFALGNSALCLAATALGLLVGSDRHRARRLAAAAAWAALVYAVVGIVNAVVDPEGLLWRERDDYLGAVLGPFVNRNTAAAYFGCGAILWTVRLSAAVRDIDWFSPDMAWRRARAAAGPGLAIVICVGAVVATGSRSGTLLGLSGLCAVGLVSVRGHVRRLPARARTAAFALPAMLAGITLLSGTAGMRFNSLGFADEGRTAVYRAVLLMIRDRPWLGTGLGTFAAVYPSYRSSVPGMRNIWDKAHSLPLEMAAEIGLPVTLVICGAVGAAFAALVRGALVRRRDAEIPLAAAGCLGLTSAQSCIDFSLQIPGLAVVVMGLVGIGLAQSFKTERHLVAPAVRDGSASPAVSSPDRPVLEG